MTSKKFLHSHFGNLMKGPVKVLQNLLFFLHMFCFFLFLFSVFFNPVSELYLLHFIEEDTFYMK